VIEAENLNTMVKDQEDYQNVSLNPTPATKQYTGSISASLIFCGDTIVVEVAYEIV